MLGKFLCLKIVRSVMFVCLFANTKSLKLLSAFFFGAPRNVVSDRKAKNNKAIIYTCLDKQSIKTSRTGREREKKSNTNEPISTRSTVGMNELSKGEGDSEKDEIFEASEGERKSWMLNSSIVNNKPIAAREAFFVLLHFEYKSGESESGKKGKGKFGQAIKGLGVKGKLEFMLSVRNWKSPTGSNI